MMHAVFFQITSRDGGAPALLIAIQLKQLKIMERNARWRSCKAALAGLQLPRPSQLARKRDVSDPRFQPR